MFCVLLICLCDSRAIDCVMLYGLYLCVCCVLVCACVCLDVLVCFVCEFLCGVVWAAMYCFNVC